MNASKLSINAENKSKLFADAKALVVDDSRTIRDIVSATLNSLGIQTVATAEHGQDALDKLTSFTPDIILLDLAMPVMDGLQFCERFRTRDDAGRDTPIILMTGMEKTDQRLHALHVGVSSIMFKPLDTDELEKRLYLHLQKYQLIKKLRHHEPMLDDDLRIAANIQRLLLPDDDLISECRQRYGVDINMIYLPSELLGGDYWTVMPIDDQRMALFIGDFSGHGVDATIETFRLHKFLREYIRHYQSPAEVLSELNRAMVSMLTPGHYLSCMLAFIDTVHDSITYAAAAHPSMLMSDGQNIHLFDGEGDVVGAYKDAVFFNRNISFQKDNTLLIFSDALVEINQSDRQLFSYGSLASLMHSQSHQGADAIYARISSAIGDRTHQFDDDLTLLCVTRS